MLSFSNFLIQERMLSIGLNPKHEKYREQHRGEIHDLLRKTYAKIGGYVHPSGTKEESDAIHNDISNLMMKATRRNGKISSVVLYKPQHGRKAIGVGSDQSAQGKQDVKKTFSDDNKLKRAWGEVSGPPETIQRRMGIPVVPNIHAKRLTGKPDVETDPNGEHYTRSIGGARHKKVIMGHPKY